MWHLDTLKLPPILNCNVCLGLLMLGAIKAQLADRKWRIDQCAVVWCGRIRMPVHSKVLACDTGADFREPIRLLQLANQCQKGFKQNFLSGLGKIGNSFMRKTDRIGNPCSQVLP